MFSGSGGNMADGRYRSKLVPRLDFWLFASRRLLLCYPFSRVFGNKVWGLNPSRTHATTAFREYFKFLTPKMSIPKTCHVSSPTNNTRPSPSWSVLLCRIVSVLSLRSPQLTAATETEIVDGILPSASSVAI